VIEVSLALLVAAFATGDRAQRRARAMLGWVCVLPTWLVPPEHVTFRALWAIVGFAGAIRTGDLRDVDWPLGRRLLHVLSIVDTRRLVAARPRLAGLALMDGAAWAGVATYAAWTLAGLPSAEGARGLLVRWTVGLVFVYALSSSAFRLLEVLYRAIGFTTPRLHLAPAESRSVQEFWGERWNRVVSTWLSETFFKPLARRRRPLVGAFLAFAVSAAVHAYIAWVAVGVAMAGAMLLFFIAQAVIIVLERVLSVRQWRPALGHVWTVAWMVGLSPLFVEATARVLGD
jgi:hypothetical protein